MKRISGIHHVTIIASSPQRTLAFYTETLGLDLLCRTVNFDEPTVLHFYCGIGGVPLISFFVHEGSPPGRRGTGQVSLIVFAVPQGALPRWRRRLVKAGIVPDGRAWAFDEEYLCFSDPDGLSLALVEERLPVQAQSGRRSAIRRIRSIELQTEGFQHISQFLVDTMGFEAAGREGAVFRFLDGPADQPIAVDLLCTPNHRLGRDGPGIAHHVAWRVADEAALVAFAEELAAKNYDVSTVLDRQFFHAVHCRAPCGLNFALATVGPGFAGVVRTLSLPPWLEARRAEIERIAGAS